MERDIKDKSIDDGQEEFDHLFKLIFHHERRIAVQSIDAVEKVTRKKPWLLEKHKEQLFALLGDDPNTEMKWHLAQIASRMNLSPGEFRRVWALLTHWTNNPNESKMVRVNSLQSLFDLYAKSGDPVLLSSFQNTVRKMERERIPSISARIKKLRGLYRQQNAPAHPPVH